MSIMINQSDEKYVKIYRKIFQGVVVPMVILDSSWNFVEQNTEHSVFFSFGDEELKKHQGLPYLDELRFTIIREELLEDEHYHGEMILKSQYGKNLFIELYAYAILGEQSRTAEYFVFLFVDKTEIRNAIRELELSKDSFQSIFMNAPEAIFIFEPVTGAILDANPFMEQWLGYSREEFQLMTISDISTSKKNDSTHKQTNKLLICEEQYVKQNGSRVDVEITGGPLLYQKSNCIIVFARDVTEKKQIDTELHLAKEKAENLAEIASQYSRKLELNNRELAEASIRAEAAAEAKSLFLANMSHELRTPLNAIIGMSELLSQTELNNEQLDFLNNVRVSANSLLNTVNDILDFSKIEAGKLKIENVDFDLAALIEETADMVAIEAFGKKLELITFIDPQLPKLVNSDPVRIKQILLNLCSNAVKFTAAGYVKITCDLLENTDEALKVRIIVKDTGIGINDEDANKLFQVFSQVDISTTRKYGGTGLGLAISKQLVEMLHGSIEVKSIPGQGSEFQVDLILGSSYDIISIEKTPFFDNKAVLLTGKIESSKTAAIYCQRAGITLKIIQSFEEYEKSDGILVVEFFSLTETNQKLFLAANSQPVWFLTCTLNRKKIQDKFTTSIAGLLTKPVRRNTFNALFSRAEKVNLTDSSLIDNGIKQKALLKNLKILVVDDVVLNQKLVCKILEKFGCPNCLVAENGVEALSMIANNQFDLVFMDCSMPEMDGYQATEMLRIREKGEEHLQVIGLSANAMQSDRDKAIAAGMDDYLVKPISQQDLRKFFDKLLNKS